MGVTIKQSIVHKTESFSTLRIWISTTTTERWATSSYHSAALHLMYTLMSITNHKLPNYYMRM